MEAEQLNSISNALSDLLTREQALGGIFDFEVKSRRLTEVNSILEDPTIWDDQKKRKPSVRKKITRWGSCHTHCLK